MRSNDVKRLDEQQVKKMFPEEHLFLSVNTSAKLMHKLEQEIDYIEKVVKEKVKLRKEFECLLTLPGVGLILALTIMLEAGNVARFPKGGELLFYCRCVKSSRTSNGKNKGEGNSKNGNKYLSWAYVEAANIAKRYYQSIDRYHQKKERKDKQGGSDKGDKQ